MQININILRRVVVLTIGVFLIAVGLHLFLIPSNLAAGGTTGLGMILNHYIPGLPVGVFIAIMNVILFVIGFLMIGKEFGGMTIYASFLLSFFLLVLEKIWPVPTPIVDDLLLNLVFGILCTGIGMGVVFNVNASTGGTDIIAKIINVFFHIDIGKSLMVSDFLITVLAAITFGAKIGLYALMGVILNSLIIDQIVSGINRKYSVMIISKEREKINDYVQQEIDRGTTMLQGKGGFTGENRPVLFTILSRAEFVNLRTFVRKVDPEAFMIMNHIHEVEGEGFTR